MVPSPALLGLKWSREVGVQVEGVEVTQVKN